jgi:hypothetical protein
MILLKKLIGIASTMKINTWLLNKSELKCLLKIVKEKARKESKVEAAECDHCYCYQQ